MGILNGMIYSGGILLLALVLLLVIPKIKLAFKKNKRQNKEIVKVSETKKHIEEPIEKINKGRLGDILFLPSLIILFLTLFLLFEANVVEFVRGYAIELYPINYVSLFTILGLVFITKGSLLGLKSKKGEGKLKAFVWISQGFALTMVALIYELLNQTHVVLFNVNFSWLIVLLVIFEFFSIKSIINHFKKFI